MAGNQSRLGTDPSRPSKRYHHFLPTPQVVVSVNPACCPRSAGDTRTCSAIRRLYSCFLAPNDINPGADDAKKQADARDKRLKEIDEFFEQARAFVKTQSEPAGRAAWNAMTPWVRGEKPLMIHANSQTYRVRHRVVSQARLANDPRRRTRCPARGGSPGQAQDSRDLRAHLHPALGFDRYDVQFRAAGILHKSGVKVIFSEGLRFAASNAAT